MSKATVMCDRCHKTINGLHIMGSGTAGFYQVHGLPWSKYANPEEQIVCDACMWRDARYIADYGQQQIGGPGVEALKAELMSIIEAADKSNRAYLACLGEFEEVYPAACGEYAGFVDDAEMKLIRLWREHRDKIGFVVWNHASTPIPEPVITAWLNEESKR